jgi:hypothetical protein
MRLRLSGGDRADQFTEGAPDRAGAALGLGFGVELVEKVS